MTVTEITLVSLKRAKNAIIGNPTAKRAMAKDEAFIEAFVCYSTSIHWSDISNNRLVYYVRNSDPITGSSLGLPEDLRLEAAHIVASLCYG
jgi:armadillo repeat-containing protein 8